MIETGNEGDEKGWRNDLSPRWSDASRPRPRTGWTGTRDSGGSHPTRS